MLTISRLAAYAGVTVRAVRHYHATGLLPEPPRDHSGYRRYDAGALVELIRIRTLAEAGVPLARVKVLLDAAPDEFGTAVAEIDQRLEREIRALEQSRERIAHLTPGEGMALPREVTDVLDRLRARGVDERIVELERDGWIVLLAQSPDQVRSWAAAKQHDLDQQPLVDLYLDLGTALDRDPDDPQLVELADRMAVYIRQMAADQDPDASQEPEIEPPLALLLDALAFDTAPSARRVVALLRTRGWTAWSKVSAGSDSE